MEPEPDLPARAIGPDYLAATRPVDAVVYANVNRQRIAAERETEFLRARVAWLEDRLAQIEHLARDL